MVRWIDQHLIQIAQEVAQANGATVNEVVVSGSIDRSSVEILMIVATPLALVGKPAALITSQIVQRLTDCGEERFPVVRFG